MDYYREHGGNQYYDALKTVVYRLNDILDAAWSDVHSDKGKHFDLSVEWRGIVDKYCCWADETGHVPRTIKNKRYAASWFLPEIPKLQCCSPGQLSPMLIASACVKTTDHNLWGEIRVFLRCLAEFEIVGFDYSTIIPHYNKPYFIPNVYSVEEKRRIQLTVERTGRCVFTFGHQIPTWLPWHHHAYGQPHNSIYNTPNDILNASGIQIIQIAASCHKVFWFEMI